MPDSGFPVVLHDGGHSVAEPSARNAGQRPVSRVPPAGTGVRQQPGRGVAAASAATAPAQAQEATAPVQHLSVSLAQTKRIVVAAERRARQIGVSMFIVVVDNCDVIKTSSSRMDGNSQASITVAAPKAVTANAFPTPTTTLAPGRAGDPTRLALVMGAGLRLAETSGDASKKPSQHLGGKQ